jgi:hypothetical protein
MELSRMLVTTFVKSGENGIDSRAKLVPHCMEILKMGIMVP